MDEASASLSGRVGRYALYGRVGRGGMGEVHRARAFGAAGVTKELCIKRIRCERLADPASLGRFVAEARVSMGLSHANIVSVFDFGRSENDYYLAMEWVDGCDLRQLLDARRETSSGVDEDVALHVAAEVARALAYLHGLPEERRVAHCDLKPANVLVSRAGEVKLADFGVAAHDPSAPAGGTRRYMAPEQRSGESASPAVDLYALGVVLDEMLGGTFARRPVTGDEEPTPHVYAPPTSASRDVAALLERLCAYDPAARPASASAVVDELEALLAEARIRTRRSPRELLARAVEHVVGARAGEDEPPLDFRTDASFVTEGGESETFARRMKPDASPRTQTRPTPVPPRPPPTSRRPVAALVALSLATVLGLAWLGRGTPAPEAAEAPRVAELPALPPTPPPAAPDAVVVEAHPSLDEGAVVETAPGAEAPPVRRTPPSDVSSAPILRATETEVAPAPPAVAPAVVRVNARPWAEVRIDGTARGVTPLVGIELAPGPHDLTFANPALGVTRTEHVDLVAGERRDVIVDLRP